MLFNGNKICLIYIFLLSSFKNNHQNYLYFISNYGLKLIPTLLRIYPETSTTHHLLLLQHLHRSQRVQPFGHIPLHPKSPLFCSYRKQKSNHIPPRPHRRRNLDRGVGKQKYQSIKYFRTFGEVPSQVEPNYSRQIALSFSLNIPDEGSVH